MDGLGCMIMNDMFIFLGLFKSLGSGILGCVVD